MIDLQPRPQPAGFLAPFSPALSPHLYGLEEFSMGIHDSSKALAAAGAGRPCSTQVEGRVAPGAQRLSYMRSALSSCWPTRW